jgi:hypothetical protein
MQQTNQQQIISPQRVFPRRSTSGTNTLFSGIMMSFNGILLDTYCFSVVIQSLFRCVVCFFSWEIEVFFVLGTTRTVSLNDGREGSVRKLMRNFQMNFME